MKIDNRYELVTVVSIELPRSRFHVGDGWIHWPEYNDSIMENTPGG